MASDKSNQRLHYVMLTPNCQMQRGSEICITACESIKDSGDFESSSLCRNPSITAYCHCRDSPQLEWCQFNHLPALNGSVGFQVFVLEFPFFL